MFTQIMTIATVVLIWATFISIVWAYWRTKQNIFVFFLLAYLCILVPAIGGFFFAQSFTTMTGEVIRKPYYYVSKLFSLLHYCFMIAAFLYAARAKTGKPLKAEEGSR